MTYKYWYDVEGNIQGPRIIRHGGHGEGHGEDHEEHEEHEEAEEAEHH